MRIILSFKDFINEKFKFSVANYPITETPIPVEIKNASELIRYILFKKFTPYLVDEDGISRRVFDTPFDNDVKPSILSKMFNNITTFKLLMEDLFDLEGKSFLFDMKPRFETNPEILKMIWRRQLGLFSDSRLKYYIIVLNKLWLLGKKSEQEFVEYLKSKGVESRLTTYTEDINGIDVVDLKGNTYQVKILNKSNYENISEKEFIIKDSKLDLKNMYKVTYMVFKIGTEWKIILMKKWSFIILDKAKGTFKFKYKNI